MVDFNWERYLKKHHAKAALEHIFKPVRSGERRKWRRVNACEKETQTQTERQTQTQTQRKTQTEKEKDGKKMRKAKLGPQIRTSKEKEKEMTTIETETERRRKTKRNRKERERERERGIDRSTRMTQWVSEWPILIYYTRTFHQLLTACQQISGEFIYTQY